MWLFLIGLLSAVVNGRLPSWEIIPKCDPPKCYMIEKDDFKNWLIIEAVTVPDKGEVWYPNFLTSGEDFPSDHHIDDFFAHINRFYPVYDIEGKEYLDMIFHNSYYYDQKYERGFNYLALYQPPRLNGNISCQAKNPPPLPAVDNDKWRKHFIVGKYYVISETHGFDITKICDGFELLELQKLSKEIFNDEFMKRVKDLKCFDSYLYGNYCTYNIDTQKLISKFGDEQWQKFVLKNVSMKSIDKGGDYQRETIRLYDTETEITYYVSDDLAISTSKRRQRDIIMLHPLMRPDDKFFDKRYHNITTTTTREPKVIIGPVTPESIDPEKCEADKDAATTLYTKYITMTMSLAMFFLFNH